jgi:hypothetical protein
MENIQRCGAADEIELAANEEQRKATADPRNESAYYEAALIFVEWLGVTIATVCVAKRSMSRWPHDRPRECLHHRPIYAPRPGPSAPRSLGPAYLADTTPDSHRRKRFAAWRVAGGVGISRPLPAPPGVPMSAHTYAWNLSQERIDMLAQVLYKAETLTNITVPGTLAAENIGRLVNDLRARCCLRDGAQDPYPDSPFFPTFEDTVIIPDPLWRDSEFDHGVRN